jgi:hypothetical protein
MSVRSGSGLLEIRELLGLGAGPFLLLLERLLGFRLVNHAGPQASGVFAGILGAATADRWLSNIWIGYCID